MCHPKLSVRRTGALCLSFARFLLLMIWFQALARAVQQQRHNHFFACISFCLWGEMVICRRGEGIVLEAAAIRDQLVQTASMKVGAVFGMHSTPDRRQLASYVASGGGTRAATVAVGAMRCAPVKSARAAPLVHPPLELIRGKPGF